MTTLIMPKATAVWLLENTTLTFDQVAAFCNLHILEVQSIADGESAIGIVGINPVTHGQLSEEEIQKGMDDPAYRLKGQQPESHGKKKTSSGKYTPIARRQDKPDAITWLIRHHGEVSDAQIIQLIGTTKTTIDNIRQRRHWNIQQIKPRSPVELGLCTQPQLNEAIEVAHKRQKSLAAAALKKEIKAPADKVTKSAKAPSKVKKPAVKKPAKEAPKKATSKTIKKKESKPKK